MDYVSFLQWPQPFYKGNYETNEIILLKKTPSPFLAAVFFFAAGFLAAALGSDIDFKISLLTLSSSSSSLITVGAGSKK